MAGYCEICARTDIYLGNEASDFAEHQVELEHRETSWQERYKCPRCGAFWETKFVAGEGLDDRIRTLSRLDFAEAVPEQEQGKISTPHFYLLVVFVLFALILALAATYNFIFQGSPPKGYGAFSLVILLAIAGLPGLVSGLRGEYPSQSLRYVFRGRSGTLIGLGWLMAMYVPLVVLLFRWLSGN